VKVELNPKTGDPIVEVKSELKLSASGGDSIKSKPKKNKHIHKSHSEPALKQRRKGMGKKQRSRSRSNPDVVAGEKKKPKYIAGFRDTTFTGGMQRPVGNISQREETVTCPWTNPCDFTYKNPNACGNNGALDSCDHRCPQPVESPCGLCYRDYDVCLVDPAEYEWGRNVMLAAQLGI